MYRLIKIIFFVDSYFLQFYLYIKYTPCRIIWMYFISTVVIIMPYALAHSHQQMLQTVFLLLSPFHFIRERAKQTNKFSTFLFYFSFLLHSLLLSSSVDCKARNTDWVIMIINRNGKIRAPSVLPSRSLKRRKKI